MDSGWQSDGAFRTCPAAGWQKKGPIVMLDFLIELIVTLLSPLEWVVSVIATNLLVPLLQLIF